MFTKWLIPGFASLLLLSAVVGCSPQQAANNKAANKELESKAREEQKVPLVEAPREPPGAANWFQSESRKYGLRDSAQQEILQPTYDDVRSFSEGLAAVNVGAKWIFPGIPDGGKWGFIDESGKLVIPIQFEFAHKFSDGLANVTNWSQDRGTMFIDRKGEVKIKIQDATAGDFREGLAPVYRDGSKTEAGWRTEYIDKTGKVKFAVQGYGEELHEGLAVLRRRDQKTSGGKQRLTGYINSQGKIAIPPQFARGLPFSEGLAAVRIQPKQSSDDDAWGYIDSSGEFVIPADFNEAKPFRNGQAMVHQGGEFITVEDGPCYWEGGSWWLINRNGVKIARVAE